MPLPQDLAGYQTITEGEVHVGDIVIAGPGAYPADAVMVEPLGAWMGASIPMYLRQYPFMRFYRQMECPRKLDDKYLSPGFACGEGPRVQVCKDDSYKALTNDKGKAPLAMLPWAGLNEVALVQAYGNEKYGDFYNFRKGMEVTRHLSCAMRHIVKFLSGETLDQESGRPHLAHAACRILYVLQNQHDNTAIDDRFKK